jgi:hypothetical protein
MVEGIKILKACSVVVVGWVAFASCQSRESVPEGILDRDQMVHSIIEVYLAEEKLKTMNLQQDSAKKFFNALDDKVFEKLGTSDSILKESFDYYMLHTRELEEIYSAVVDSLNLMEQRAPTPEDK